MKQSTIKWHLARDNQLKLARFCEKHKMTSTTTLFKNTFNIKYEFDNGGYIIAELLRGTDSKGYSIADHFQVVDYNLGSN